MDRVAENIVVSGLYKSLVEKRLNLLVREFSAELQISHVPGRLDGIFYIISSLLYLT